MLDPKTFLDFNNFDNFENSDEDGEISEHAASAELSTRTASTLSRLVAACPEPAAHPLALDLSPFESSTFVTDEYGSFSSMLDFATMSIPKRDSEIHNIRLLSSHLQETKTHRKKVNLKPPPLPEWFPMEASKVPFYIEVPAELLKMSGLKKNQTTPASSPAGSSLRKMNGINGHSRSSNGCRVTDSNSISLVDISSVISDANGLKVKGSGQKSSVPRPSPTSYKSKRSVSTPSLVTITGAPPRVTVAQQRMQPLEKSIQNLLNAPNLMGCFRNRRYIPKSGGPGEIQLLPIDYKPETVPEVFEAEDESSSSDTDSNDSLESSSDDEYEPRRKRTEKPKRRTSQLLQQKEKEARSDLLSRHEALKKLRIKREIEKTKEERIKKHQKTKFLIESNNSILAGREKASRSNQRAKRPPLSQSERKKPARKVPKLGGSVPSKISVGKTSSKVSSKAKTKAPGGWKAKVKASGGWKANTKVGGGSKVKTKAERQAERQAKQARKMLKLSQQQRKHDRLRTSSDSSSTSSGKSAVPTSSPEIPPKTLTFAAKSSSPISEKKSEIGNELALEPVNVTKGSEARAEISPHDESFVCDMEELRKIQEEMEMLKQHQDMLQDGSEPPREIVPPTQLANGSDLPLTPNVMKIGPRTAVSSPPVVRLSTKTVLPSSPATLSPVSSPKTARNRSQSSSKPVKKRSKPRSKSVQKSKLHKLSSKASTSSNNAVLSSKKSPKIEFDYITNHPPDSPPSKLSNPRIASDIDSKIQTDLDSKIQRDLQLKMKRDLQLKLKRDLKSEVQSDVESKSREDSKPKLQNDFRSKKQKGARLREDERRESKEQARARKELSKKEEEFRNREAKMRLREQEMERREREMKKRAREDSKAEVESKRRRVSRQAHFKWNGEHFHCPSSCTQKRSIFRILGLFNQGNTNGGLQSETHSSKSRPSGGLQTEPAHRKEHKRNFPEGGDRPSKRSKISLPADDSARNELPRPSSKPSTPTTPTTPTSASSFAPAKLSGKSHAALHLEGLQLKRAAAELKCADDKARRARIFKLFEAGLKFLESAIVNEQAKPDSHVDRLVRPYTDCANFFVQMSKSFLDLKHRYVALMCQDMAAVLWHHVMTLSKKRIIKTCSNFRYFLSSTSVNAQARRSQPLPPQPKLAPPSAASTQSGGQPASTQSSVVQPASTGGQVASTSSQVASTGSQVASTGSQLASTCGPSPAGSEQSQSTGSQQSPATPSSNVSASPGARSTSAASAARFQEKCLWSFVAEPLQNMLVTRDRALVLRQKYKERTFALFPAIIECVEAVSPRQLLSVGQKVAKMKFPV
eukprot:73816_1